MTALGCGGRTPVGYVTGSVSYDGKSVPPETRIFFEKSGQGYIAAGIVQEDGSFTLKRKKSEAIEPGDYAVFVGPPPSQLSEAEYRALKEKVDAEYRRRGEKPPPSPDWVLPTKYYQSSTSPLGETIEPGENVFEIVLED
ncbi:MAG: hypothetical protein AAF961_01360 [Planctomycetota bacterium]